MNKIGQENAIIEGRTDSLYWDVYDNHNDIGHPARPLERLAAQSSFPGQMRHGQVARHRAGALSQE